MAKTPKTETPTGEPKKRFEWSPGPKQNPGGTKNNRNHMRHGLTAGKLPEGCQYVENKLNAFRRILEDALIESKGEVSLTDASLVQTCIRWERHSALALRWLRLKQDELSPTDLLKFSEAIAKASTSRDKALQALNLDAPPEPIDLEAYIEGKVSE